MTQNPEDVTFHDIPTRSDGILNIEMRNKWFQSWNFSYLRKTKGILRILTLMFSLAAFIAVITTPFCHYGYNCLLPAYKATYRYFAIVTMSTVVLSIIMAFLNVNCHISDVVLKPPILNYVETSVLSLISFFLLFGNIFLIGHSGGRISYQTAAVLGTISLTAAETHLIIVAIQLKKLRKRKRRRVSVSDNGQVTSVRQLQAPVSEPILLNGSYKLSSIYANCEEPIDKRAKKEEYSSSDSFDDSDDDAYPNRGRLEITRA